jgi:hypothetical protein
VDDYVRPFFVSACNSMTIFKRRRKSLNKNIQHSHGISRLFNITVHVLISQYSFSSLSFSHPSIYLFRKRKELLITIIKNYELGRMWKKANTICLEGVINITTKFTQKSEPLALILMRNDFNMKQKR